jgi:DNA-directed RNA polymerase specialized sigma24 family protein
MTVQKRLLELHNQGWTYASIADELQVPADSVRKWAEGRRVPRYAHLIEEKLEQLLSRKRIPKKKRYKVS